MEATGHCLCGAVTFTARGIPNEVHSCHCNMCQRWNGGPALAVSVESVEFGGAELLTRYESSAWAERGFCSRCGSNLFYRLKDADHYMLAMGSFDDYSKFKLAGEIYIDEKPAGYAFTGDHSRMTGAEFLASLQGGGE